MRSKILVGASAWALGLVAATAGSFFAVDQLGQGLLDRNVTQVTIARVNAELATESSERASTPSPSPASGGSSPGAGSGDVRPSPAASTAGAGQLLTSADGTVVAVCKRGGAYLVYWSPQQGFEAEHVRRGPASTASVTFDNTRGGDVMEVTCSGGTPVAHVTPFGRVEGGSGHDN